MRLATFDIFDTALIRRCGSPSTVFALLAQRLWPNDSMRQVEFINLRRQAESAAGGDATIADIYSHPGFALFPEYSAEQIMTAEMAIEQELLTVNPAIKSKIETLRKEGWTIKFLSDMYLPSSLLEETLRREGCLIGDEEVIVSCEWKARKDRGNIFPKVRQKFNPSQWMHFGDNRHSDYDMPRRHGIKATHIASGYTPIESAFKKEASNSREPWTVELLAGASRMARMQQGNSAESILAADYVAAAYVPYVIWLLRESRRRGVKRLHFLSRDGYIMMKIAEALGFDDIELRYLFVSRKALMKAYLSEDSAARFVETIDGRTLRGKKVNSLLERLQLSRADYNLPFERIVTAEDEKLFIEQVFTPELTERFRRDAELCKRYLVQEGLADGTTQAMVDIGWLGSSRMMINGILGTNIPTYYLGVRHDVYDRSCGDFDSYFPCGALDTVGTALIENYYSASPWPSTIGYELLADGHIGPRFAPGEEFTESAIATANIAASVIIAKELRPYLKHLSDELLYRWAHMTLHSLIGLQHKVDITPFTSAVEFDGKPFVRKLSAGEVVNMLATGAQPTAFNRASLELTMPALAPRASAWHVRAMRVRTLLYRALMKLKNR